VISAAGKVLGGANPLLVATVTTTVAVLAAIAVYLAVEKPLLKLLRGRRAPLPQVQAAPL
jgi:peptidoglycan/LPS O-acetylase OafA/YrhL